MPKTKRKVSKTIQKKKNSSVKNKRVLKAVSKVKKTAIKKADFNKSEEKAIKTTGKEIKKQPIISTKPRLSRHVLDLKKVMAETEAKNSIHHKFILHDGKIKRFKKENEINFLGGSETRKLSKIRINLKPIKLPELKTCKNQIKRLFPSISLKLPEIKLPQFSFSRVYAVGYWPKAVFSFLLVCLIVISPFKAIKSYQNLLNKKEAIISIAQNALKHLDITKKAAASGDYKSAASELSKTASAFTEARNQLQDINFAIKKIVNLNDSAEKQYSTAERLLSAGEKLARAGKNITSALEKMQMENSLLQLNLTENIELLNNGLVNAMPEINEALEELNKVDNEAVPEIYREKVTLLKKALAPLAASVKNYLSLSDFILKILGQENSKRYLVLFQNNNEIRATGGFIGSYAVIDVDKGNIKKISIPGGGPYDLKSGLKVNLESPMPLHLVNYRWEFQDGNWFYDLPSTAEKLAYLYEKSGGTTTDGMIFINASFMKKLLSFTGPIELENYGITVDSKNVINELQKEVEINYDKEQNKPKQIINDLFPLVVDKILKTDRARLIELLDIAIKSLDEKEIQFYFSDYDLEKFINDNNWGGKLIDTKGDYLSVVSSNIAGEKTDAKIDTTALLEVKISDTGEITNELTITKKHKGIKDEPFYGVANLDYLRIYTPKGSELISAEGFTDIPAEFFMAAERDILTKDTDISLIEVTKDIDPISKTEIMSETGMTVFANWFKVEPGETKTAKIKYKSPIKIDLTKNNNDITDILSLLKGDKFEEGKFYSLVWQKQSGKEILCRLEISLPSDHKFKYVYPAEILKSPNQLNHIGLIDKDKIFAFTLD